MKKAIAFILTAALCVSLFGSFAFAQEKQVFKVVNLGDSTSVGQALDDYGAYGRYGLLTYNNPITASYYDRGFMNDGSRDAYPAQLARYIQGKNPDLDVQFTNLGVSGIRSVELLKMIDPETVADPYADSIVEQINQLWEYEYAEQYDGMTLSEFMVQEIKNADLITVDALLNCFTAVLEDRFAVAFSDDEELREEFAEPSLHELIDKLAPGAKEALDALMVQLETILGVSLSDNMVKTAADVLVYCYLDCCVRFSELIDKLRELNPDARILVGGTYNPLPDLKLTYDGHIFCAGQLLSAVGNLIDKYVVKYAPQRNEYTYINLPQDIETYRNYMTSCGNMWELSDNFRNRMICDMFTTGGNYYSGNIFWAAICARSKELGGRTDSVGRTWLSADVVADMIEIVQEQGENADPFYRAAADVTEQYINRIIDILTYDTFDAVEFIKAWVGDIGTVDLMTILNTPIEKMDESEKAAVFCHGLMHAATAAGAHFSLAGCNTKFACAVDAYENCPTPEESDIAVQEEMKQSFVSGILGTLKAPVLDAIFKVLDTVFNRIEDFFLSFLPSC